MADKQAFVYIVDQGKSMGEQNSGRDESDLDYGMRYIWDKIATTMSASRSTWAVGVVGLRTDSTKNFLEDDEAYHHISIMKPLGPMLMPDLNMLQEKIKVSTTNVGDAISAIIIAIDMIEKFTKGATGRPLKYFRKIVLLTNGQGALDADDTDEIAKKLNDDEIDLVVVGVDFDDLEFGYKEEGKDNTKASNEAVLKSLTDKCTNATFGTIAEAVENLAIPVVKDYKPYAPFKGQLTLGDPEKYDTAICIDVERYFKTKVAKPTSASNFVTKTDVANGEASAQSSHTLAGEDAEMVSLADGSGGLAAVKMSRTYKVIDESAPGGKRDVDREDLAKGYEYGRTAIAISESDENVTKLETTQSFAIVGFIPCEKYERYLNMGESHVTIAARTNDKARMALSSLIHALHELESCAVARIVLKNGKDPQLLLLGPSIEPDLECLIDVPLPFAEDIRLYRFPPLDRVTTVSGTVLKKHRFLPTDDLSNAMNAYVDSMDLSTFGRDDEGRPTEYMAIEDTFSPVLHRINQAVRRRAVKPDEPVQPPAPILVQYSKPPDGLVAAADAKLKKLIATADVKKVPPKVKGKRRGETMKPMSGLDVESLLGREKRLKITSDNAVPEFRQMLTTAENVDSIEEAAKQMMSIIRSLITHSVGDSGYGRALEDLRVMREELMNLEEPGLYNDFVKDLKNRLLAGDLGGDRRDMMWEVRRARLGLIDKNQSEISEVSDDEASEFYSMRTDLPQRTKNR